MADRFLTLSEQAARRTAVAVKSIERQPGYLVPKGSRTHWRQDYPVPIQLAKVTSEILASSSAGTAAIWASTMASTAAPTALGATEACYSWAGVTASSGEEVIVGRDQWSGRLYLLGPHKTTYLWRGRGNDYIHTDGTSGGTIESSQHTWFRFQDNQYPQDDYGNVGVNVSTDLGQRIEFSRAGTYYFDINANVQISAANPSSIFDGSVAMEVSFAVLQSTDKTSTGFPANDGFGNADWRHSVTKAKGGAGSPSNTFTLSGFITATSNHAIGVRAILTDVGIVTTTDFTVAMSKHSIDILRVDNGEAYTTS